jgi:SAM-dependent methyltransferase
MPADDISLYYDELHRWTEKDKNFQTFSGLENDTIHRFLIDPATGAFSPDTIYKFVDPQIAGVARGALRGLDAGCGYGGTCFHGLKLHGGHWTGITTSEQQWLRAKGIADARGVSDKIEFHRSSFDDPLPGRYDVIVAIESLIHSADPARTFGNLAAALDPGGRLIVVDDMPLDPMPEQDMKWLEQFKRCWRCPVAPGADRWIAIATQAGLRLVAREDLSHLM